MDLAKRSLFSISWNFLANLAVNGVAFVRAILLARLLPVNVFGIYAGYHAILNDYSDPDGIWHVERLCPPGARNRK